MTTFGLMSPADWRASKLDGTSVATPWQFIRTVNNSATSIFLVSLQFSTEEA